jgi:ankyrin repeat protein
MIIGPPYHVMMLSQACWYGDVKCVEILLDNGSHVDYQDEDLWSPLHMAAACNHINIVQLLLEHGADTTLLDVDSKFALDHTTDANIHSIISDQMAENGIYEEDLGFIRSRLYKAMLAAVRGAVSKHKDLKIFNKNGVTPVRLYNNVIESS